MQRDPLNYPFGLLAQEADELISLVAMRGLDTMVGALSDIAYDNGQNDSAALLQWISYLLNKMNCS